MSTPPPASQRSWRAACPNCGAPVEFRSPASASAVCSFCRSTLVREGEALRKIGQSAELFDDFTPLQLGASGRYAGEGFVLVGRLQFGTEDGPWNEWHALFDNGRDGWLSEDNGRHVFAFDLPVPAGAPDPAQLQPGSRAFVDGRAWNVGSRVQARLLAAEGELHEPPPADRPFTIVDLRNESGEVATLDASLAPRLQWSVGRPVQLSELKMQGLREASEKTLQSQAPACPSCGAPLAITLSTSQSVVSISSRQRAEPIKPVPPVTRIRPSTMIVPMPPCSTPRDTLEAPGHRARPDRGRYVGLPARTGASRGRKQSRPAD